MGGRKLGWSGFAYLRNRYFPQDWALEMAEKWALDSKDGFFWDVPLSTAALKDFESVSRDFTTTPDTNYYASIGMYKSQVGRIANTCALAQLKKYNWRWGIPIAPEAFSRDGKPWGDTYSNFNAGKILFILEGMAGIDYSIPDDKLTVCDTMPEEWGFMELRVPMKVRGKMRWPTVTDKRQGSGGVTTKTVSVRRNPLGKLEIQPWLEEGTLQDASKGCTTEGQKRNHIGYNFLSAPDAEVTVTIKDKP